MHSLSVSISSIGLSLIDRTPREILYLSASGLRLSLSASAAKSSLALTVATLQVDNQLPSAIFPVLLRPSWSETDRSQRRRPHALEMRVVRNASRPNYSHYDTVSVRLQTMQLMADTLLARTLLLFSCVGRPGSLADSARLATWLAEAHVWRRPLSPIGTSYSPSLYGRYELFADAAHVLAALLPAATNAAAAAAAADGKQAAADGSEVCLDCTEAPLGLAPKTYLRWLNIQPLRLLVSCRSVAGGIEVLAGEGGLEGLGLSGAPSGAVGLLNSMGTMLSNVDRVPIKLNALVLDNAFASPERFRNSIAQFYQEQLVSQLCVGEAERGESPSAKLTEW